MKQVYIIEMQKQDDVNKRGYVTMSPTDDEGKEVGQPAVMDFPSHSHAHRFLIKNMDDLPKGWLFMPKAAFINL